jgi:transketolase
MTTHVPHAQLAAAIRALSMDAVQAANSGHPGMPMGMADVATVLYTKFLKFDPSSPEWPDRDRFVLSAGHGSMLIYSLLYLTGYPEMDIEQVKNFRQLGSKTAGHPEYGHAPGIEVTTGPLGQGIATSVGMALAERMLNARYGDDVVDHYTYVIAGDGCLMEGISHEAIDLAGHQKLSRLIVLFDDNSISIDGATQLSTSTDQLARFAAAGWDVERIDGHNPAAIEDAITRAKTTPQPSLIACRTLIGKGAPNKQGTAATHGAPLGDDEIAQTRVTLGWPHAPFEIPADVLSAWRAAGDAGRAAHQQWQQRLDALEAAPREQVLRVMRNELPANFDELVQNTKQKFSEEAPKLATRQSSQKTLETLTAGMPNLLGGSADLTGSNGTKTSSYQAVTPDDYSGTYLHYGVREHGMAAAMNGIALHGGFIPYGGTFLVFSDYSRPAIRLAALMGTRVIHVMTHDSIGLGEDGPTHQPVEHVPSLRAIPNVLVFRPADAVEVAESWEAALRHETGPSVLCLTRQGLPTMRTDHQPTNLTAQGAYVVREVNGDRDVTLLATGSEVEIAMNAAAQLAEQGVQAAVVSMPCWELFEQQDAATQQAILGSAPRIGIEAAVRMGWDRWIGSDGTFIGMQSFGASGPAEKLYEHFGITPAAIVNAAKQACGKGE